MTDNVEKFSDFSDDDSKEKKHSRENNRAAILAAEIQAAEIRAEIKAAECIVSPRDNHVEPRVFRKRQNINERFVRGLLSPLMMQQAICLISSLMVFLAAM